LLNKKSCTETNLMKTCRNQNSYSCRSQTNWPRLNYQSKNSNKPSPSSSTSSNKKKTSIRPRMSKPKKQSIPWKRNLRTPSKNAKKPSKHWQISTFNFPRPRLRRSRLKESWKLRLNRFQSRSKHMSQQWPRKNKCWLIMHKSTSLKWKNWGTRSHGSKSRMPVCRQRSSKNKIELSCWWTSQKTPSWRGAWSQVKLWVDLIRKRKNTKKTSTWSSLCSSLLLIWLPLIRHSSRHQTNRLLIYSSSKKSMSGQGLTWRSKLARHKHLLQTCKNSYKQRLTKWHSRRQTW